MGDRAARPVVGYRSIAVASSHMGAEYARHGVPASRINVLPLFPTLDVGSQRADGSAVLFAGRMTTLKGGDLLVEAVADASRRLGRRVPLVMAGEGPQRGEWARQAAARGVAVEFTGWVDRPRLASVFQRAGVVVIPSVWPEPFGLVGLEAGAMGLPAIAFDVGGIREWLRPGENGLLVAPGSGAAGLADAIVSMLSEASVRGQMSIGARAVATEMSRARSRRPARTRSRVCPSLKVDDEQVVDPYGRVSAGLRRRRGLHCASRRGAGLVRGRRLRLPAPVDVSGSQRPRRGRLHAARSIRPQEPRRARSHSGRQPGACARAVRAECVRHAWTERAMVSMASAPRTAAGHRRARDVPRAVLLLLVETPALECARRWSAADGWLAVARLA